MNRWISTSHNSALKSLSTKPLWVTTRDALVVTALTVVTTLLVMALYWWYYELPTDFVGTGMQTAAASMAAQYLYEYSGVNNMIAESSLRYAKGSTLSKYTSRREAAAYTCFYKLKLSGYESDAFEKRFQQLLAVLTTPDMTGAIADYANGKIVKVILVSKFPESDILLDLPLDTLRILESLSDNINDQLIYDILVNGFEQYHTYTILGLDEKEIMAGELRGKKIIEERKL